MPYWTANSRWVWVPELPLPVVASLSRGAANAVSNASANCCSARVCPAAPSGTAGASGVVTEPTSEAPAAASAGSTCPVRRSVTAVSSGNTTAELFAATGAPDVTSAGGTSSAAPAARQGTVALASASSAVVTCWVTPSAASMACSRSATVDKVSFAAVAVL